MYCHSRITLTKQEFLLFNPIPYDLYYSIYYNFRASLSQISLHHKDKSVLSSRNGDVVKYLSEFLKLTHLTYDNNSEYNVTVYEIRDACLSLTSVKIDIPNTIPPLFQIGSNMLYRHSNSKELSVSFANISANYIEYIIKYLPKSVESLDITIIRIDLYDWIYEVGIDNVLKLTEFMNTLPRASLSWSPEVYYKTQQENPDESNMTTFFKVLNAFKGDKKARCDAIFSDSLPSCISMTFSGRNLRIVYGLRYTDLYDDRSFQFSVPDRNVSIIGLEVINNLVFDIYIRIDIELACESLKCFLTNFQHLQLVEFKCMRLPSHGFTLTGCMDYFYKGQEDYDPSTVLRENLKIVKLKNFIPSKEFIDLLSYHLTNVQGFTCIFERSVQLRNARASRDYVVDLTRFKSLQLFYFDTRLVLNDSKTESCFIKFEYTDGKENYYQLTENGMFKRIPFEVPHNRTNPTVQ
ncbi:hypothetical protein EDC94DRAFT_620457 [Helicostylum pulchrum]|nr:hypothetical protein EDC94DRAFT_620457 [Helicostylum pulchrum]